MKDKSDSALPQGIEFDEEDFDHAIKGDHKIIKLTFWNLFIALRMSNDRFEELMERYGYIAFESWYKATSPVEPPIYYLHKEPYKIVMQWIGDDSFCSHLREEMSKFYVRTDEEWDIYSVSEQAEPDIVYTIYLQNKGELRSLLIRMERES